MKIYDLGPVNVIDHNENGVFDPEVDQIELKPNPKANIPNKNFRKTVDYSCPQGTSRALGSIDFGEGPKTYLDFQDQSFQRFLEKYGVSEFTKQSLPELSYKIQISRAEDAAEKSNYEELTIALDAARESLGESSAEFENYAEALLEKGAYLSIGASLRKAAAFGKNGCYFEMRRELKSAEARSKEHEISWDTREISKVLKKSKNKVMQSLLDAVEIAVPNESKSAIEEMLFDGLKFSVDYDLEFDFKRAQKLLILAKQMDEIKAAEKKRAEKNAPLLVFE